MKSAKAPVVEAPSHRRSQPVRQTRTNPPRSSATAARSGTRDSLGGPVGDQPIDIFPAITHFADTITALPKELVRHFTLLKEVDAKIFAPQEQLFKLVASARTFAVPEALASNDAASTTALSSAPANAQTSSNGIAFKQHNQPVISTEDTNGGVFDPSNLHRRQLFRQTAIKIQEMLVSLEEKNHVISTANEALQRQLARAEDVWPYLENEFSDEAKWGSTTHWAYPENRNGKNSAAERSRRDGAAAISAAAQALAEQAAARSDARKQAVQAKKSQKVHALDSEADDHDSRNKDGSNKKTSSSKVRKTADSNNIGLGISTGASSNSNPPQKRRKVDKEKEKDKDKDKGQDKEKAVASGGEAPQMERAMSLVFGNNSSKTKPTTSPRETPAPEVPKKRKALPTSSGQSKKKYGFVYSHPLPLYSLDLDYDTDCLVLFQECSIGYHVAVSCVVSCPRSSTRDKGANKPPVTGAGTGTHARPSSDNVPRTTEFYTVKLRSQQGQASFVGGEEDKWEYSQHAGNHSGRKLVTPWP